MFEIRQGDQAPMIDGVAVTASAADLNATATLAAGMTAVEALATMTASNEELNKLDNCTATTAELNMLHGALAVRNGAYAVVADDDTANTKTIATGLTAVTGQIVQVIRAGKVATGDAAVSHAAGGITIADGATFVLTTADIVNWIAFGTL